MQVDKELAWDPSELDDEVFGMVSYMKPVSTHWEQNKPKGP